VKWVERAQRRLASGFLADIVAGSLLVESKDIACPPRGSGSQTFPALARSDTALLGRSDAMPDGVGS